MKADSQLVKSIEVGQYYKHYKGNTYKIVALAKHSETGEDMVVYTSPESALTWVRPLRMWFDVVDNTTRFIRMDESE